jgi:hypothetical protein
MWRGEGDKLGLFVKAYLNCRSTPNLFAGIRTRSLIEIASFVPGCDINSPPEPRGSLPIHREEGVLNAIADYAIFFNHPALSFPSAHKKPGRSFFPG